MAKILLEKLARSHDRASFDCGKEALNTYLQTQARQHQDSGFAATWVAIEEGRTKVLGYMALAMGSVAFEDADEAIVKRLPRHPIPVLHVARLATDSEFQGRGIGKLLLGHAADLAIAAADSMGVHALELFAIDQEAYGYYLKRGFLPLKGKTMRLYAPLKTLKIARTAAALAASL